MQNPTSWTLPIRGVALASALMGSLLGNGCLIVDDGPFERGDLTLFYDFEGLDCFDAGVDSVDFELRGERGDIVTATTSCSPNVFTFVDLREDDYIVYVDGYDFGGGLLYSGTFAATVFGGSENEVSVSLDAAGGDLTIFWTFDGSASCFDVYDVHVLLRDPFGDVYDDAFYACEQDGVTYHDLISGGWDVWLDGLDAEGFVLYSAVNVPLYVEAGADNVYDIDLTF